MKYQGTGESDVMVNLRATIYDMRQIMEFIEVHASEAEASNLKYNFYAITRLQRELRESIESAKQALNNI